MSSPRAVIGAPVYNHEREFREAIESILSQTFRDFRLVIVDDCSTDGTAALAQHYVQLDSRVAYYRNDQRLGMIDNWRRAFDVSLERWPDAEYFAWASDHDVWHPRWLATLIRVLDATPEAVLAYPWNRQMAADGRITEKRSWQFDTSGVTSRAGRFRKALMNMSAGNMIYGLARARDIKACGVFRHVLVPDRLLIMELALRGEFRQMPEVLWFRRVYGRIFSLGRQRKAFFPNGRPWYALIPWWICHATVLGWVYGVRRDSGAAVSRSQGLLMAVAYFWLAGLLNFRQQMKQLRIDLLEQATFLRPAYQRLQQLRRSVTRRVELQIKAFRRTRKNVRRIRRDLGDAERRHRIIAKIIKRMRGAVRAVPGGVLRATARGIGAVPGIGPRLIPSLLWEPLEVTTAAPELRHLRRTVGQLRRVKGPVVFGPFLGEAEYELLYWIPFVRWLQKKAGLDPQHTIVVSRGGVAGWYDGVCGRYADALDVVPLSDIRSRPQVQWHGEALERSLTPTALDLNIVSQVARRFEVQAPRVIHPSEMQRLFRHVWKGAAAENLIDRHIVRQRLAPPPRPAGLDLPDAYVAVRFAFGPSFPGTIDNQRRARALIETLAAQGAVVLLNSGFTLDGLEEFDPGPMANLWRIDSALTPATTLGVQSAVIGRASAFTGTFDGFGCIALQYGVPAVTVYSETPGATPALIDGVRHAAAALQTSAVALHVRDLDTLTQSGALLPWPARVFHGIE